MFFILVLFIANVCIHWIMYVCIEGDACIHMFMLCFADIPVCTAGSMWMKIGEVPTSPGYVIFTCCMFIVKIAVESCSLMNCHATKSYLDV